MSWLSRLTGKDAYKKARREYQNQMQQSQDQFAQSQQLLQPFVNWGMDAGSEYGQAMRKLLNPQALQDEFMSSYEPSEQAKYMSEQAQSGGLDAASSMGIMGSTPALQAIQKGTSNIMADDKQRYLDQLMQKYLAGAGIAGNIYGTGASSAGQQANIGAQAGGYRQQGGSDMSQFRYGEGMAGPSMLGNIGGALTGLLGGGFNTYMMGKMYPNLFGGSK